MSTRATRIIMEKLQNFSFDKTPQSCSDIISKHLDYQSRGDWKTWVSLLPIRFVLSISVTAVLILFYYVSYCSLDGNGRWVSKTMHLPTNVTYHLHEFILNALFPSSFPLSSAKEPYWQCPDKL